MRRSRTMAGWMWRAGVGMLGLWAALVTSAGPARAQARPVVVIQSGEAATLDWHMHCDKNAHEPDRQIFDTLLRRNPKTLQLEASLAESWRLLNDTTWQFRLRRGVHFHNGEPFDAAAVKFSIERMLDPKQAAPGRTSIATIDHVDVVDPYTVNVVTKAPFPLLPVRMSPGHCGTVGIVPPKYLAQVGDAGFAVKVKITNYLMPGPWQEARVRKAINLAVDMDTIIKTVLEGYGQVLGVPLEKEAFGFNPNVRWWGYDPERAKALLREAGYPNGFEMTLHAPNRRYMNDIEVMQAIAQMLGKVGIRAKVEVWEQSIYTTKWRKRELLPAYMTAWGGAGVFDGDLLVNSLHSKSALAIYKNEALDKILEEAQATNDAERRKALYAKAQELIYEEAPIIKAYQQAHIFGVSNRLDWKPWIDNMLFLSDARLR